jgi:hypothetical protein
VAALIVVFTARGVSAHRLDECLQSARVAVEPDHLELQLSLTPGVEVAARIIGDLDRDGDGTFTASEQAAFSSVVFGALELTHDGQPLGLESPTASFPDITALQRGEGTIHFTSRATLPAHAGGEHRVGFRNRYRPEASVYLANALVPESQRVAVTMQHRATDQHQLVIDYTLRNRTSPWRSGWLWGALAAALLATWITTSNQAGLLDRVIAVYKRNS